MNLNSADLNSDQILNNQIITHWRYENEDYD